MENKGLLAILSGPKFILALILITFFLKGVFLAAIQPIFTGQDEARHYDTVQYLAEPENAVSETNKIKKRNYDDARDKDNFDTYNFSQEIQKTAAATDTDILRGDSFNTILFSDSSTGKNESEINSKVWKPYNYYSDPDIAGTSSLYHKLASQIERLFADQTILVRFYLIRIFSVLLGTLAVFFCYLTAKTIGFSSRVSLILSALLSFQPKFSLYFTNINYDVLLIPMFFLFAYAGVLALKQGPNWKNLVLLGIALVVAIQTKGTGYILAVVFASLITYIVSEKMKSRSKRFRYEVFGLGLVLSLAVAASLYNRFLLTGYSLEKTIDTLGTYIAKTITFGRFILPSDTYWGILGWTNNPLLGHIPSFILLIETLALVGIGLLLFSKKFKQQYPTFLPAKKYILFLAGMIIALQLGVRAADWTAFSQLGSMAMSLGTPGRYFLPNLSAHILLLGTGLGAILAYYKKERHFESVLLGLLILMFALMTYLTFDAIILRFYF